MDGGFDDGDWLWIGYDWRPVLGIQSVRHDILISDGAVFNPSSVLQYCRGA